MKSGSTIRKFPKGLEDIITIIQGTKTNLMWQWVCRKTGDLGCFHFSRTRNHLARLITLFPPKGSSGGALSGQTAGLDVSMNQRDLCTSNLKALIDILLPRWNIFQSSHKLQKISIAQESRASRKAHPTFLNLWESLEYGAPGDIPSIPPVHQCWSWPC